MRKCKCKECKREFYEDDSNPNIHYSSLSDLCDNCKSTKNKKGWYQSKDGEYNEAL